MAGHRLRQRLVRAFDRISGRPERSFKGVRGRLRALVFVVLLPSFLLGALGTSYLVASLFGEGTVQTLAAWAAALGAGFGAAFVAIAVIYLAFGPGRMPARALTLGAGVAAAATSAMSLGFAVYLGHGADFEERVAGSGLASVVLLALWLYLANVILLLGYALGCSAAGSTPDPAEGLEDGGADGDDAQPEPDAPSAATSDGGEASSISSAAGSVTSSRR